jgi:hypothetical protein
MKLTHEQRQAIIDELMQRDLNNKAYLVMLLYVGFDGYLNMSDDNLIAMKEGRWVNENQDK